MQKIKLKLTEYQELRHCDYPMSFFESGKSILLKNHEDNEWYMYNKKYDDENVPFFENKNQFYYIHEYDKDKVILTRHENIAQFFKKYYGVNARVLPYARICDIQNKTVYCGTLPHGFEHFCREEYSLIYKNDLGINHFEKLSCDELAKNGVVHHTKFWHCKN